MAQRKLNLRWLKQSTPNLFALLVVGYLLLGSVKLIVEQYRITQSMHQLERDYARLEQQNTELKNLAAYYRTESFKEKEARQRLGFQKPGERVVAVPVPNPDDQSNLTKPGVETQPPTPLSNPERWWQYFFGPRDA